MSWNNLFYRYDKISITWHFYYAVKKNDKIRFYFVLGRYMLREWFCSARNILEKRIFRNALDSTFIDKNIHVILVHKNLNCLNLPQLRNQTFFIIGRIEIVCEGENELEIFKDCH